MNEQPYINPRFSGKVNPETEAPALDDLREANRHVDSAVLKIIAEQGRYLGAAHPQENLQAYAKGYGELMTYALFEANMDGVKACAPLTHSQLTQLMELNAELGYPQGAAFVAELRKVALDIDPTPFEARPDGLHAA